MLSKIEYVYGKDKAGKVQLLGAKVYSFNGDGFQFKEFYVGQSYSISELSSNAELASSIGINDIEILKSRVDSCDATGVIYFPQIGKYELLESGDTVLPFESTEKVESTLSEVIAPFRENTISREVLDDYVNGLRTRYSYVDQEDSRSELCDLPLSRQRISAR